MTTPQLKLQTWRPGFNATKVVKCNSKIAVLGALFLPIFGSFVLKAAPAIAAESKKTASKPGPKIVKKELTITCSITPLSKNGVVLAQGGDQRGYVIYLKAGKPIFTVRQNGKPFTAASKTAVSGHLSFKATLAKDGKMTLVVNGKVLATAKAPGLFAMQPKDGLSIGQDSMSAVGDYKAPNPIKGKVESFKIGTK